MSDRSPNPRFERLVGEFAQLSPEDQDLVLALVSRFVHGPPAPEVAEFAPDVAFMDFDE
ncbi:MAG: hypothetical protein QOK39_2867 [Acidimicrobiaceae bacterium]|jgi:hypothetical protein|nr:hypothetical protein [Acidimicrobiaceae bacterium]